MTYQLKFPHTKMIFLLMLAVVAALLVLVRYPQAHHYIYGKLMYMNRTHIPVPIGNYYLPVPTTNYHLFIKNKPNNHVVFAKVHKSASSTVHNILTRYAIDHKLNKMIHPAGVHINHNGMEIAGLLPLPPGVKHYDILCNHLIFNYTNISPYFPQDTVYVGIIREPLSNLLSSFKYFTTDFHVDYLLRALKSNASNPVEELVLNAESYHKNIQPRISFTNNRQSVDLGFPYTNLSDFNVSKTNMSKIQAFLKTVESTFDLIMVVELFDESLVLLRRLLNWTTRDIMYFKTNVNHERNRSKWASTNFYEGNKQFKSHFDKWNAIDVALYKHFRAILEQKLSEQPEDFFEEVKTFKQIRQSVSDVCNSFKERQQQKTNSSLLLRNFPATAYSTEFNMSAKDCHIMALGEIGIAGLQQAAQKRRLKFATKGNDTNTEKQT